MSRTKIAAAAAALLVVFLLGFVPQWLRVRALGDERDQLQAQQDQLRAELALARLETRLGAALTEAMRSNYERSRQLMTGFFSELQQHAGAVDDPALQEAAQELLAQRDEIITLLSRAEPEATQRLMLMYTRLFAAVDPAGRAGAVTPVP